MWREQRMGAGRRPWQRSGLNSANMPAWREGEHDRGMMETLGQSTVSETAMAMACAEADRRLSARLAGVVLLAGSIRDSSLSLGIGRSLLDLPLATGQSILGRWCEAASLLAETLGIDVLPVRVMLSSRCRRPVVPGGASRLRIMVDLDPGELRGTGGLLQELAQSYAEDELLLVATGTQVLCGALTSLATSLATHGDIALLSNSAGESAGLMLASCGALASIQGLGYVDLKEQALPELARRLDVKVVKAPVTANSVRTLAGYLSAVRSTACKEPARERLQEPYFEDWFKTFEVREDGASVDEEAMIHDAVVLSGSRVGANAVVVRSVVCPGASVAPGAIVCDQVVTGVSSRHGGPR